MNFGEWIKANATLLVVGIAVLWGGWYLGSQGSTGLDELEKKTSARLESIDSKLKSFDATGSEVNNVAAKLATLEKTSAPMTEKIGALSSELKSVAKNMGSVTESIGTVNENIGAVKNATGEQIAAVNERLAALEAKLADIVAQQIKLAKATTVEKPAQAATQTKAKASNRDGVSLGIAESGWLIDDKLYVTLSYVYPGGERVRVGMDGRLYELTKGAAEDFSFEGKRCRIEFTGLDGDKANVRHECAS